MNTTEKAPVDAKFLADRQSMWNGFLWLCGGGVAAAVVILVALALIFVV